MHFIRVSVAVLLGLFVCVILFSQISIHSSGYRNINNFSNQFHIDYINDYRQSPVTESFLIQADANNDNNNDILPNGKHKIYSPDLTAYVAIYTHFDTRYDEAHIQGVRTMYKTLQSSNPHNVRNRLVLVSENTPDSIRQLLISDGLIVKEMINTENEVSTCSLMFNRLHLWQLTEYKRVLFIENDVIVLRPLDEIFSCGKFCMVYNSIQHFTDAVFVVEPNIEIYHQLISAYNNIKFPTTALIVQGYCQEELWHFFLRIFGDLEASPLFEHQIQDYQRDEPLMRMQASISLNAMMWYEHFSWRLMRSPQFRNYTDEQGIPAYTLSFTTLKPYHWIPGLFFNLAWYWHDTSDKLLNKSYSDFLTISVISIMCLACFVEFGITRLFGALYSNTGSANARIFLPQLRRTGNALCSHYLSLLVSKIGVDHASIVVGAALTFILGYLLHFLIPITIPAHLAWPVFIFAHILLIYGAYKSIGLCYLYSSPAYKRTNSRRVSMADSNDNNTNIENDAVEIQSLLSNDINSPSAGQVVSGDESSSFDPRRKPTESDIAVPSEAGAMIRSTSANTLSNNMTVISNNTNTTAPTNNSNNNNNNNTNNSNNNNNNSAPAISSIQFTLLDMMYVLLWELLTFYFMRQTFYPEFVVKMFIVFPMVLCCFVSSINICYYIFVQLFGDVEDDIYDNKR